MPQNINKQYTGINWKAGTSGPAASAPVAFVSGVEGGQAAAELGLTPEAAGVRKGLASGVPEEHLSQTLLPHRFVEQCSHEHP